MSDNTKEVVYVCERQHKNHTSSKPVCCTVPGCREAIVGKEVKLREGR